MARKNPYFAFKKFRVEQGRSAMKVTTDACLFGALLCQSDHLQQSQTILDIGAGTGLLSLMAAQNSNARITAVEVEVLAAEQASGNFTNSPWANRLQVVQGSIQSFLMDRAQCFDTLITNPPFFQQAFKGNDPRRNMARHTDTLSFAELASSIRRLLAKDGEAWVLLPVESSVVFLLATVGEGLSLHRRISLRSTVNHSPHRHMLVLKHASALPERHLIIEETLTIYQQHPHYTEEVRQLMTPYYLAL
ncbi:tRNA1(Val) (adenine(37)-N6)-methyltransferase [Endozoicomonas sp.]|uniref:tRNA1(Val) (adenine(37)-N6)-methyltransferase n=1 Tax=Endozoicomonas sp. TaxID=1892382 RepID=UPI002888CAED|nr:methyltransferase [Endozoicomonas sp.]